MSARLSLQLQNWGFAISFWPTRFAFPSLLPMLCIYIYLFFSHSFEFALAILVYVHCRGKRFNRKAMNPFRAISQLDVQVSLCNAVIVLGDSPHVFIELFHLMLQCLLFLLNLSFFFFSRLYLSKCILIYFYSLLSWWIIK